MSRLIALAVGCLAACVGGGPSRFDASAAVLPVVGATGGTGQTASPVDWSGFFDGLAPDAR